MSAEEAYYTALAFGGRPQTKRLFRQPAEEQEAMVPRLAKAIVAGTATHRISPNAMTGEKTWLLNDQPEGEWWMIDPGIERAARALVAAAYAALEGRGDSTKANLLAQLTQWDANDRWTVIAGRDPASRLTNSDATPAQLEKALAYANRQQ